MGYRIKFEKRFLKQLSKLDKSVQEKILFYIADVIEQLEDPRKLGKMLTGDKFGLYRYRVGDYRLVCRIIDRDITIIMISVGHRKNIYKESTRK